MATSSRRIRIPHPSLANAQRTNLTADWTSGGDISVLNNDGFAAQGIAVIGYPGEEKTESQPIASITGQSLISLSGGPNFSHNKDTIVLRSEYDQVEVSYFNGSVWTTLTTKTIEWDHKESVVVHQGGLDTYSYRFRFKNSVTLNTTEYSGSVGGAGYTKNQVGYMMDNVRKIVNDPDRKIVSDLEILRLFTAGKDIIRGVRADWYFWRKEDQGSITTTAAIRKYNLDTISTSLDYIKDVRFKYNDGTVSELYPIRPVTDLEWDQNVIDQSETGDDHARIYNLVPADSSSTSGYIQIDPPPLTTAYGSFYVRWYVAEADYTSPTSTTLIPIPQLLENYAISTIERFKGNEKKAEEYKLLFYGPPPEARSRSALYGIPLLEQMHKNKLRALGLPRQLLSFRGGRAIVRAFSQYPFTSSDIIRENYW